MLRFILALLLAVFAMPFVSHAGDVSLAWNPPQAGLPTGYLMERKVGITGDYSAVGYPTGTEWIDTDKNLGSPGVPVCWQVRAIGPLGKSEPSNELCLSLPDAPSNFRLVLETTGPSATAPRVSVRTRVRKK